jgi:hypothetical protein
MPPTNILLLRHAEKPYGSVAGVKEDGSSDKESLIVRGWERAGTWTTLFGTAALRASFGVPKLDALFGAMREELGGDDDDSDPGKIGSKSRRPVATITPLGALLGVAINETYTKGQEPQLVQGLMAMSGNLLVCWQHEAIPAIAKLIVNGSVAIPDPWPGDRFDVIWMFTSAGTNQWTFTQVCPALMPSDSTQPIT